MTTATSHHLDNKGVRLHYLDTGPVGPGDEAPIVFVPGMTDVADDYLQILPTLGRRAVVMDLRGHGRSSAPPDVGYGFDDQITDVDAVIGAITDGPVHVMTFSRGTCYAIGWSARNADRVRSISIGDYPAREIAIPEATAETFIEGRWRGTPVADRVDRAGLTRIFAASIDRPLWSELASIDAPVLVVRSTADFPISDEDWARYGELDSCRREYFDESPHDIFRPDRHRYPELVRAHVAAAD